MLLHLHLGRLNLSSQSEKLNLLLDYDPVYFMAVHYLYITFRILSNQVSDSIFYLEGVHTTFIVKMVTPSIKVLLLLVLHVWMTWKQAISTGVVLSRSSPFQNLRDMRQQQQQQQARQANVMHNNDVFTSINCKSGECVRWGGGGWWAVSDSGKGVQNLMGL